MSFNSWNNNSNTSLRPNTFGNAGSFGQPTNANFGPGFGTAGSFQGGQPQPAPGVQAPQPTGFGGYGNNAAPASAWGAPAQNTGFGGQNAGGYNSNPFSSSSSYANPGQAAGNPFNQGGFSTGFMSQPANNLAPAQTGPSYGAPAFAANQNTFNQAPGFNSGFAQNPPIGGGSLFNSNPNPQANQMKPFNNSFTTAASSFNSGAQPAGGLFSNNSFLTIGAGMNSYGPNTAVKYKPTSIREDSSNVNVLHLCALAEMGGKCIDEQRLLDYKQRSNPNGANPTMALNSTAPGASLTGAFNPNPASSPFATNPMQGQSNIFAKPPENKPPGSLFTTASANPLMFSAQNPGGNSIFAQTPNFNTNPANPSLQAPTSMSAPQGQNSLFSNPSLFNPNPQGNPQGTPGAPSLFSNASQANSLFNPTANTPMQQGFYNVKPSQAGFAQSQPGDSFSAAFRDPHGLNWLFPDILPDTVIQNYKERYAAQISAEPLSAVERLLKPKRFNNYPQILTEKWKNSQEKKSLKSNPGFDLIANRKAEPFFVSKRTNFVNLKLEEYKDEDGSKYFKLPGSNSKRPGQVFEIAVRAHDPSPIKVVIQVSPEKTMREIRAQVRKSLPDIEENCIQLLYKSKIVSPEDTVSSLGIGSNDELIVIIAPVEHNVKTDLPSQDMLPKIPAGYRTSPTYIEMARMGVEDLKKVENFTVLNEFGKVMFYGQTNVLGLNVAAALRIVENEIVGYPDDSFEKPSVGKGLNKLCEFTIFNMKIAGNKERAQQKARSMCEKIETEFVSYTQETSEMVVKLKHL